MTLGSVQRSYGYDAAGRLTLQTDTTSAGQKKTTYGYDEAGQLISYVPPTGNGETFTYDANGNRRSQTVNGQSTTFGYVANSNRLSTGFAGTPYVYTASGAVSSNVGSPGSNGRTNNFDIYGRMSSSSSSRYQDAFLYNGLGQRVQKLVQSPRVCNQNAMPTRALTQGTQPVAAPAPQAVCTPWQVTGTVRYVYDTEGHLLGEYDSTSGYSQETVWFNGQPVATVQAGKVYYVYADNLGTPRSAVRASDNVEMWRWDSEPFGSDYPTAPNPTAGTLVYNLRFPGQVYDAESGLHYNGMRDYDPFMGRYIEADPLGLGGGLARYAYVSGNPLSYSDSTGRSPVLAGEIGFEIGFGLGGPPGALVGGLVGLAAGYWASQQIGGLSFSNPFRGTPWGWASDGKQDRLYGADGWPSVDIDTGHDHGAGDPHAHNWSRPADGGAPTNEDRGKGQEMCPVP